MHSTLHRLDGARLAALDRELARTRPPDRARTPRFADALLQEARALGVRPPEDKLAGINVRVARVLDQT